MNLLLCPEGVSAKIPPFFKKNSQAFYQGLAVWGLKKQLVEPHISPITLFYCTCVLHVHNLGVHNLKK